jgi:hypothetical protein
VITSDSWITFQFCRHEIDIQNHLDEGALDDTTKLKFKAEANIGDGMVCFYLFAGSGADESAISINVPAHLVKAMADVMAVATHQIPEAP